MGTKPITLTDPEQRLVDCTIDGTILDFAPEQAIDQKSMPSWGDNRTIRAEVIREILLGRLAVEPDPRGLHLRGAKVAGRLQLTHIETSIPLQLIQCFLEEGADARDAQLPTLVLAGSHLTHGSEPGLDASRLRTGRVALNSTSITCDCTDAAVRLVRTRISDSLGFQSAIIHNKRGPAISADGLLVERNVALDDGFVAECASPSGTVRLLGGWIGGDFSCSGATLRNRSGPALVADKLRVDQSVALNHKFTATGASADGAVRFPGASIGGQFSFTGAIMHNVLGPALFADRVQVEDSVFLRDGLTAIGSGEHGTVTLSGARIGGDLVLANANLGNTSGPALVADGMQISHDILMHDININGIGDKGAIRFPDVQVGGKFGLARATLHNNSGPALDGDRIHVKQGMYLDQGLDVIGAGQHSAVRLSNARFDAEFQCIGVRLNNDTGPALFADGMQVAQNLEFGEGFAAVGNSDGGAVRLLGANIGGQLQLVGSTFLNDSGPALSADRVQVRGNVAVAARCSAVGAGSYGALRLSGARIDGQLSILDARLHNESGPALTATELQVGQSVKLSHEFQATGAGSATIDLSGTRINGRLIFDPGHLKHKSDQRARLDADGLIYAGLPITRPGNDWLDMIRHATPTYAAQPYQQLAAAYRSAGQDTAVRNVLIAQRRDHIDRGAVTGQRARAWSWIVRVTLSYGYKPWRALWWLAGVVALAVIVTLALGQHGAIAAIDPKPSDSGCGVVEQVSIAIDMSVPLIKSETPGRCSVTTAPAGQILTFASWTLQLLAWAFATLFVAGFTGAVRKV